MNARLFLYISRHWGLILAGLLAAAGCAKEQQPSAPTAGTETVELGPQDVGEAAPKSVLSGIRITGAVNPSIRVEVKSQVAGQIDSIPVERGMVVTQGQVLAIFDDRSAIAQMQSVKAQLAAAERDLSATELLFKAGAASERAYINSKVAVDSANAQLVQVQENYDHGKVRSPIAGIISERLVSSGESAGPGQKLFNIVNSDTLEFTTSILPDDFAHVKTGMRAILTFDSFGNRKIEGSVVRIDPVADARSRQVGVCIDIPNKDGRLVAGIFASGTIVTNSDTNQKVIIIPASALRTEGGQSVVYAVGGGKLIRKSVVADAAGADEGYARIQSGLAEGEKIVLNPAKQLKDGDPVKLIGGATL